MDWSRSYESLMAELGLDPYACGCGHRSRGMLQLIFHARFCRRR